MQYSPDVIGYFTKLTEGEGTRSRTNVASSEKNDPQINQTHRGEKYTQAQTHTGRYTNVFAKHTLNSSAVNLGVRRGACGTAASSAPHACNGGKSAGIPRVKHAWSSSGVTASALADMTSTRTTTIGALSSEPEHALIFFEWLCK
jgi:hypothetical protein